MKPSLWKQFPRKALDILFPLRCIGCGRAGDSLCGECRSRLPRLGGELCTRCCRPLGEGGICAICGTWPLAIDGIFAPFPFQGVVRQAIHLLKYQNYRALAEPLSELLASYWQELSLRAEALVPVPLHARRLHQRGYNQSALLARYLGQKTGLPVQEACLVRQRNTPPQARTNSAIERWANTRDAFQCFDAGVAGKAMAIIDDVCTTGATLDAAARALKAAGAGSIWGLTVAREV